MALKREHALYLLEEQGSKFSQKDFTKSKVLTRVPHEVSYLIIYDERKKRIIYEGKSPLNILTYPTLQTLQIILNILTYPTLQTLPQAILITLVKEEGERKKREIKDIKETFQDVKTCVEIEDYTSALNIINKEKVIEYLIEKVGEANDRTLTGKFWILLKEYCDEIINGIITKNKEYTLKYLKEALDLIKLKEIYDRLREDHKRTFGTEFPDVLLESIERIDFDSEGKPIYRLKTTEK